MLTAAKSGDGAVGKIYRTETLFQISLKSPETRSRPVTSIELLIGHYCGKPLPGSGLEGAAHHCITAPSSPLIHRAIQKLSLLIEAPISMRSRDYFVNGTVMAGGAYGVLSVSTLSHNLEMDKP